MQPIEVFCLVDVILMHCKACCCCLLQYKYNIIISPVVIGFDQVDYATDESINQVQLSVSVQDGNIHEAEIRIITLTTSDGTAQCMLVLVALMNIVYST